MPSLCDFSRERALHARGLHLVAGVDEVGRGPLAGPVAAAAVVLDPARVPDGLDDSKRCDGARRETLYEAIMASALGVGIAFVPPRRIDAINIRQATLLAMRRAVAGLAVRPDHILVDGNDLPPELPCPAITVVDGDALVASIAAASIVAKVVRDRLMTRLGLGCPGYAFEAHKGYATPVHRAAIARHGPCAHHRVSFAPFRNGTEAA